MPPVTSPEELLIHELQDLYYAEKTLTGVLPKLADEAKDRELARAFTAHRKQTEKHVKNLERAFEHLGKQPQGRQCPGIEGIKKEHDEFVREQPRQEVLDLFLTGAAARTEHYEIAAYTGLVSMAKALKQREVAQLLEENLREEKEALKTVEGISKRLLKPDGRSSARAGSTRGGRTQARKR